MDGYVTKTTDPVKRVLLGSLKDYVEIMKKVGGIAYADSVSYQLGFDNKLRKIDDLLWELTHELSDLLVYKKVDE